MNFFVRNKMVIRKTIDDRNMYPICQEVIKSIILHNEDTPIFDEFKRRKTLPVYIRFSNKSLVFDISKKRAFAFTEQDMVEFADVKKDLLYLELSDMFVEGDKAEIMASINKLESHPDESTRLRCRRVKLSRSNGVWKVVN